MSTKNKAGFTAVLAGRETVVHWQRANTRTSLDKLANER